jgi:dTMP kinase
VVCDRYADSSLAYQGYGRGLDLSALHQITSFATGGLVPDLTLFLDIEPEQGLARRRQSGESLNRLDAEKLEFHQRVRAGYMDLIARDPSRWIKIDAGRPPESVREAIAATVAARLKDMHPN